MTTSVHGPALKRAEAAELLPGSGFRLSKDSFRSEAHRMRVEVALSPSWGMMHWEDQSPPSPRVTSVCLRELKPSALSGSPLCESSLKNLCPQRSMMKSHHPWTLGKATRSAPSVFRGDVPEDANPLCKAEHWRGVPVCVSERICCQSALFFK